MGLQGFGFCVSRVCSPLQSSDVQWGSAALPGVPTSCSLQAYLLGMSPPTLPAAFQGQSGSCRPPLSVATRGQGSKGSISGVAQALWPPPLCTEAGYRGTLTIAH